MVTCSDDIFFLCGIYSIRTSMVTCCDYTYILCGDTYIMNATEQQLFWQSPSTARTRTITKCFCFYFLCFLFVSRSFVNKD